MRVLTDEHFPSEIAEAVRREMPRFDIQSIHGTNLAGLLDQPLLAALDLFVDAVEAAGEQARPRSPPLVR